MTIKNISTIRGTGFKNLDGSLVTIMEQRDDGTVAVVPFGHTDFKPIIIDSRCIQQIDDRETYSYTFKISKHKYSKDNSSVEVESNTVEIPKALRDVPVATIIEYLTNHLQPLLKLE